MIPTVINNSMKVVMLFDTGAAHSVIGKSLWKKFGKPLYVTETTNIPLSVYPLSRFDDITAKLSAGKYFSTIDLKDAYLELNVLKTSIRNSTYYRRMNKLY